MDTHLARGIIFFAVGDVAEHSGHLARVDADYEWTYQQDVTGAHGTVLYEGRSAAEAQRALDAWLVCDATENGTYCYTHNPRSAPAS